MDRPTRSIDQKLLLAVMDSDSKASSSDSEILVNGDRQEALLRFSAKLLNGAIAGTVGVTCIFPLDLCKTRLQNQICTTGQKRVYKNLFDCLFKVARAEGPRGLYKGLGVNLALINPEKALKLAVNDQLRQMFGGRGSYLPIHLEMLAGGIAGFCQVAITTPMEMLKIQLQIAGKAKQSQGIATPLSGAGTTTAIQSRAYATASVPTSSSALKITKDLLQTKGIKGIYRGLGATLARDVPFSCIYFPLFSFFNLKGAGPDGSRPNVLHSLASGCFAGMVASISVNPIDVIKTRLQVINRKQGEPTYTGIIDCAQKIFNNEGVRAFYKGAVPRIIVIAPLFGIAQTVYFFGVAEWVLGLDNGADR